MTTYFADVRTSSYVHPDYWPGLCYGDLHRAGLLDKRYERGANPDCGDIVWTVVGDIEFTDTHGNTYSQGDEIVWEK